MQSLTRRLRLPFNRWYANRRLAQYHSQARTLDDTVRWAMEFGGGGLLRVKTLQVPFEILALARRVEAVKPRVILEIGTARGGTLLIWSRLASEATISCDLQDMRVQEDLFTRFPPPGSKCRVTLLSGDSHAAAFRARVAETLAGRQVDFLFIDGDHREAGVTADYEDYRGFVRPGGLIAFHDIVDNQPLETNQVNRLWRKLRNQPGAEELIDDPKQCGFGIGVIRVPG